MYDNANGEKVKRREILKEGEKDMYLTVVLKSKTLKTEIDFSNKKECYEFAEGLMEKMKLKAAKITVSEFKQHWIHFNFDTMKINFFPKHHLKPLSFRPK